METRTGDWRRWSGWWEIDIRVKHINNMLNLINKYLIFFFEKTSLFSMYPSTDKPMDPSKIHVQRTCVAPSKVVLNEKSNLNLVDFYMSCTYVLSAWVNILWLNFWHTSKDIISYLKKWILVMDWERWHNTFYCRKPNNYWMQRQIQKKTVEGAETHSKHKIMNSRSEIL